MVSCLISQPCILVQFIGVTASAGRPRPSSPRPFPTATPGKSQGVSRPAEKYNLSNASSLCLEGTSVDMPNTPPPGRRAGGIPTRCLNHIIRILLTCRSSHFELFSDVLAPRFVSKPEQSHPMKETCFGFLSLGSGLFSYYPKVTASWRSEHRLAGEQRVSPFGARSWHTWTPPFGGRNSSLTWCR